MPVKNRFADLHEDITAWRRDIHAHPELLFDTVRTAGVVADKLKEFGVDTVETGVAQNGVVGVIKGKNGGAGRVIGLRADMDALPILENTGVDYASGTPGVMHACGHDGHTAMLLGAAKYLAETRNFDGTVVVRFQPAEEGGGGGRVMVEEGVLERHGVDEVYGMHNWPGMPVGSFSIRPGPFFAAADLLEITVTGLGGHAAKPHMTIDTTVVASHIVLALQSIVSRNLNPVKQAVVSITSFETSSTAFNVIPNAVTLKGTVRTFDPEVQDLCEDNIRRIAENTAAAFGATVEVDYQRNYPATVNAETETDYAIAAAKRVSGDCAYAPLVMGGEDFSFMLNERPGAYILVGNGDTADVHNPDYNFDDEAIPAGCSYWAELVEMRLPVSG